MNTVATAADKRTDLPSLAAYVSDGMTVAIGGGLSSREPMAVVRELIRQGRRDLRLVGSAHGIDVDLLCQAGAVGASAESYVGFEHDFGMAPGYRRAIESGAAVAEDSCCYTIVQQLRAAAMGLPFMPIRSVRGTDFETLHPEYVPMRCPFTGQDLLLVPAITPDVAIIHAQYGDVHGNLRIEGPPVADRLFARASRLVLATVERIVTNDEIQTRGGVTIPYFYVTAIAEVPFGAHPTACYPFYAYDRPHTARYIAAAKAGPDTFRREYLEPYVLEPADHAAYVAAVGGKRTLDRLASWSGGDLAWRSLYEGEAP